MGLRPPNISAPSTYLVTQFKNGFRRLKLGGVVKDVRTVFERRNDATIYIPSFYSITETTIS